MLSSKSRSILSSSLGSASFWPPDSLPDAVSGSPPLSAIGVVAIFEAILRLCVVMRVEKPVEL